MSGARLAEVAPELTTLVVLAAIYGGAAMLRITGGRGPEAADALHASSETAK